MDTRNLPAIFLLTTMSAFYGTGIHGKLVEVPMNQVLSSENETALLQCVSNYTERRLTWYAKDEIYNGYYQQKDAPPYLSVERVTNGNVSLKISHSDDGAQTYLCKEPGTLMVASAEVICIKSGLICEDTSSKDAVILTCSIEFRGNWAPTVEWKEQSGYDENVLSVKSTIIPNLRVTSTLVMEVQKGSRSIFACTAKFYISGKPLNTTATNVPEFNRSWTSPVFAKPEKMAPNSATTIGTTVAIVISVTTASAALGAVCVVLKKRKRDSVKNTIKVRMSLIEPAEPTGPHVQQTAALADLIKDTGNASTV